MFSGSCEYSLLQASNEKRRQLTMGHAAPREAILYLGLDFFPMRSGFQQELATSPDGRIHCCLSSAPSLDAGCVKHLICTALCSGAEDQ